MIERIIAFHMRHFLIYLDVQQQQFLFSLFRSGYVIMDAISSIRPIVSQMMISTPEFAISAVD